MAKPLRIALTKGRLEKDTVSLLEKLGYDCTAVREKGRRLILPIPDANLEVVLAKANDVITYVEHGVCDMGVVGKDTIIEMQGKFFELVDLGFGRCKFALATKKGSDFYSGFGVKCIATKYPNVARRFFESKGMDVDIVKIEGSVELAPLLGLADGTEEIPKVDKIVGPGNIFVATAKKLLYGVVDIDMIAGPSEVMVLADETADPKYVAADLMSQAEHDVMASAILVTTCPELAEKVQAEVNRQVQYLSRKEIIEKSMNEYGAVLLCNSREEAAQLANMVAPEHLEVLMENPMELLGALDNVGSLFLGAYASEPLGDYYAGPNHVLPTSGTARFFSPLGVQSFTKRSSYTYYTRDALREAKDDIVLIANKEGLTAHANAITVRFEDEQ